MPEDISPTPPPGRVYEVLTPGDTLGDYTVEACICYDILGSLYRVVSASGEVQTLFVLPHILTDDESFMRRFKDLRDKLNQLTHPAILSLGESTNISGRICFTAEAISGKSIPDYLGAAGIYPTYKNPQGVVRAQPSEESKDFTQDKVRKIARTVLEALEHAHAKSTLHLNLTPSNIILTDSGEAKVVGFGLYSIIGQAAIEALVSAGIPAVSLGPRNVRLNTADIISPEIHLKQDPDSRADIYAFGMSVYWMLTGLKPSANYRPPSGIVPGLEPGWDIFLARCLTREKAKRYATATAAIKDLDNLASLTTGGFANDPKRLAKSAPRSRKQIILAAAAAASIAALGTWAFIQFTGDSGADDRVPPGSPYVRAEDLPPAFIFKSDTPELHVVATRNNATFVAGEGELAITAPPGRSRFMISAQGFAPRTLTLQYDGKKPLKIPVKFSKNTGIVAITTAPNAMVYLESEDNSRDCLGATGPEGTLTAAGVPAGTYTIVVEKEKCQPATSPKFEIKSGAKATRNIVVEGQTTTLVLESTPDGAQISIDGADSGTTPMTLEKLKPGSQLDIVFSKANYRPVSRKVIVDAGGKMVVNSGPMVPAKGAIEYAIMFSGRPADDAKLAGVTVARNDDQFRKRSWPDALTLPKEVAVGYYMLKVEHPDYEPFQTAFTVEDDKTTKVNVPLRAIPSPLSLVISPEQTPYTLRVNSNEYVNQTPPTVPAEVPLHIEVEARDYETWKSDLVGKPRQPLTLNVALKKLAAPANGAAFAVPYLGINLVWIPGATTRLGSPESEVGRSAVEGPFTWATWSKGYWMSSTEITQGQFERVLGYNPSRVKKAENPVDSVSYADALRFCKAINERELRTGRLPFGYEYRLPNELEWEYACRAGTTSAFAFGNTATRANGNFLGEYPPTATTVVRPEAGYARKVASFPANAYGLHDMHGNVREWVIERYKPHLPGGKRTDYNVPVSATESTECSTRGGSYRMGAVDCRSASRPAAPIRPDTIEDDIGFRIVLAPSPTP